MDGFPGGFFVDHVVIRTPARDGLVASASTATDLPALDGYSPAGEAHSRGVRFAGGPFLDVFTAEVPSVALILRGRIDEVESLAAAQGWATRMIRREDRPAGTPAYPWSMALFRRGQGLLTQISVIDYDPDPGAWASPQFASALYPVRPPPETGARLARVWLGAADRPRAARDLEALGYGSAGPVTSAFAPHDGELFRGDGTDLVLCAGIEGVARLDVASAGGPAREVILPGGPVMVLDEGV